MNMWESSYEITASIYVRFWIKVCSDMNTISVATRTALLYDADSHGNTFTQVTPIINGMAP